MTAPELLTYLRGHEVALWVDGDRLRYRAPAGMLTPTLRAELAEYKEEILALLRPDNTSASISSMPTQQVSRDKLIPLSMAQHGLWLSAQTTDHPPFNHPLAFRIGGPLNVAALERSLNEIVRRHEILRTTCTVVSGEPVQVVKPSYTLLLPTVDLRDLIGDERETSVVQLATDEAQQPFDLAQGPLLRAKLFRVDEEAYVLIVTTHTFVADGYSQGILLRELGQVYEAFSKGEPSPLAEKPIQFGDYAIEQRQMLQRGHFSSQLAYWKQQLKDSPPMLRWPVDNLGHTVLTYQGKTKGFSLPADLSESIRAISYQEGVTVFTVLLAALETFLYRLTEQTDLIIGTIVSNRSRSEFEGSIGYFANNLILRTHLSGHLTFRELLQQCHEVTADAFAHQDLPFEKLLEELSSDPEVSAVPLLQIVFVLHDHVAEDDLQLPGLKLKKLPVQRGAASRHLHIHMMNTSGPLTGSLEYSTEFFDANTIDLIVNHFKTVLKSVATNPQQKLAALPVLRKAERDELIQTWNNTLLDVSAYKDVRASDGLKDRQNGSEAAPQNELERFIASIWQEILELEHVGVDHSFFDLGGRSIHIIQVHSRLQKFLKQDVSVIDLFRYPTIRLLSQHLSTKQSEQPALRQNHDRADLRRTLREQRLRARSRRS